MNDFTQNSYLQIAIFFPFQVDIFKKSNDVYDIFAILNPKIWCKTIYIRVALYVAMFIVFMVDIFI